MQVVLRETFVAAGGERIEIHITLPKGATDLERARRNALEALAELGEPAPAPRWEAEVRPGPANVVWTKPDLHGKTLKSVHRVALAIHELTEARKTPNIDNITNKARVSRPPVYNIADPNTPAGQYMAPYVVSQKIGREIVLDLTPRGRQLVSLIRAGKVPA